jgi:hypothetical protein
MWFTGRGKTRREARRLEKNRSVLRSFLGLTGLRYYNTVAQMNIQHVIENLAQFEEMPGFLDYFELRQAIAERLGEVEHTYKERTGDDGFGWYETPEVTDEMSNAGLLRVYLMLRNLRNENFIRQLGIRVEEGFRDPFSEHGGLLILEKEVLKSLPVKSEFADERNPENKNHYQMSEEAYQIPHAMRYHIHALREDCSDAAWPSDGEEEGDLFSCAEEIRYQGQSHCVVLSKLFGRRFNVDYYGGINTYPEDQGTEPRINVLDLGNYEYSLRLCVK